MSAVRVCSGLLAALCGSLPLAAAATPVGDAVALYKQRRYAEAKAALERIVAADPSNAPACYFLGMALQRVSPPSLDGARAWLSKAVRLDPRNEGYLAEYAGATMLIADRDSSLGLALEGRDAMARAIAMNPSDLAASEGLMRFCAKAPWPLEDPERALALAAQVAKRDPKRGSADYLLIASIFEKQGRAQEALSATQAAQKLARGGAP